MADEAIGSKAEIRDKLDEEVSSFREDRPEQNKQNLNRI